MTGVRRKLFGDDNFFDEKPWHSLNAFVLVSAASSSRANRPQASERVRRLALEWIAALNDAKEYNGNRDHQEDVNQASEREGSADADQP
jgi:hypothetical protein